MLTYGIKLINRATGKSEFKTEFSVTDPRDAGYHATRDRNAVEVRERAVEWARKQPVTHETHQLKLDGVYFD